ncbi:MAG TPA: S8 family serine peptidase, partial [Micromonosporaceae bacterium]
MLSLTTRTFTWGTRHPSSNRRHGRSPTCDQGSQRPVRRFVVASTALMCVAAALLPGSPAGAAGPANAAGTISRAARCTPAAAPTLARVPWPQQRFDPDAVARYSTGAGVTVAVIDSGVDAVHPQLRAAVRSGMDLLDGAGDGRLDCVGHGTAVASLIAARWRSGSGLRGLAPAASILPIRVSERVQTGDGVVGAGDVHDLAAGIRAATDSQPRPGVLNLSI